MAENNIPFLDLVTPHQQLEQELVAGFQTALRSAAFIGGPVVEKFERDFASYCQAKHCVGLASGTDALRFALMAAGVQNGDAVITVPNTFIATSEAISQAGARPYFVDVDERTYNMDPEKLREFLKDQCVRSASGQLTTKAHGLRVKAVVPVHLYGQMADMDAIMGIADEFGLIVVEDACQAHGAEYFSEKRNAWVKAGSVGFAAAFSFYPGKNLGACGEAGAVTTNDEEAARKIRMIRDHGQAKKYYHDVEGYNGRLDAIQASILSVKLNHLPEWTEQRQQHAQKYNETFAASGVNVVIPFEPEWSRAVYHLYVVRVNDREALQAELSRANIGTGIHYPVPLHQQKAYAHLGYRTGDFPVTERLAPQIVSLPMFPQLTTEQVERVVMAVKNAVAEPLAASAVSSK
jgi:dTDP-4-amino-4,6-dideoxygalactose transaminase